MSTSIKDRIKTDLVSAMKAKEQFKVETIRLLNAAIKQREVDERVVMDDMQIISIIQKMIKQRRDSIEQFVAAKRNELAEKEKAEIALIESYLPTPLSQSEIEAMIKDALAETGAKTMQEMGKVMAILKNKLQGRADVGAVSAQVKKLLG